MPHLSEVPRRYAQEGTNQQGVGKLHSALLLGPRLADEEWPDMKIDANSNIIERIGHMGDTVSKWDNGLYVDCCLLGTSSTFLIDSGSTATLLSDRIYFSIPEHQRPRLNELTHMVKGANGADISVHGYTNIDLELGGSSFKQPIIVCDILPDGVLGQDFLLKFANKIDYKKLTIDTGVARIPCWIGG